MSSNTGGGRKGRKIPGEEYLSRREGSAHWQIDFTIDGQRFRSSSGTEAAAAAGQLALKQYDEAWQRIKLGVKAKVEMTLNDAFSHYYIEVGAKTAYGVRGQRFQMRTLLDLLGRNTFLSSLDDNAIAKLVQKLQATKPGERPRGAATSNRYLSTLSVVCKRAKDVWGVHVGEWKAGEHQQKEPKGREVFLDHGQARAFLDAFTGHRAHAAPIILFELMTGLRLQNCLSLTWEQISMDMGRALLVQKGGTNLSITLVPEAIQLLERIQSDPQKRKGHVWVFGNPAVPCECSRCLSLQGSKGKPIRSIRTSFRHSREEAGASHGRGALRFHDLRHTFASWLAKSSGNLKLVQEALGHADIKTTSRYVHLLPGHKAAAIEEATAGLFELPAPHKKDVA